jgi:hypothetical protein
LDNFTPFYIGEPGQKKRPRLYEAEGTFFNFYFLLPASQEVAAIQKPTGAGQNWGSGNCVKKG